MMKRRSPSHVREALRNIRKAIAKAARQGIASVALFTPAPHSTARRRVPTLHLRFIGMLENERGYTEPAFALFREVPAEPFAAVA